jgi:glycosyltransferase involved in cell wall biosynthesis
MKEHSAGLGLGEKIHFLGAVENDTIPLVLNAADIFVLPSLSEGFSNSLLEAMALRFTIHSNRCRCGKGDSNR